MTPYSVRKKLRSSRIGVRPASERPAKVQVEVSEGEIHEQVVEFLRIAMPPGAVYHHSPNEGRRGTRAQADLKRTGVQAGWPDLEIAYCGRVVFIELKRPKARPNAVQDHLHDRLRAAGFWVFVCHSVQEVEAALVSWGMPMRAKLA